MYLCEKWNKLTSSFVTPSNSTDKLCCESKLVDIVVAVKTVVVVVFEEAVVVGAKIDNISVLWTFPPFRWNDITKT